MGAIGRGPCRGRAVLQRAHRRAQRRSTRRRTIVQAFLCIQLLELLAVIRVARGKFILVVDAETRAFVS